MNTPLSDSTGNTTPVFTPLPSETFSVLNEYIIHILQTYLDCSALYISRLPMGEYLKDGVDLLRSLHPALETIRYTQEGNSTTILENILSHSHLTFITLLETHQKVLTLLRSFAEYTEMFYFDKPDVNTTLKRVITLLETVHQELMDIVAHQ